MRTVGAYEAKTHFGELLSEVAEGEMIVVTRHGVPVARIIPFRDDQQDVLTVLEDWRRYRREQNITLGEELTIRNLIEEGRA